MQVILHRVNRIRDLENTPVGFGVEIDVRGYGNELLLRHDPVDDPDALDRLEPYLERYRHGTLVFNLKEAGYEQRVIGLAEKYGVRDYFLLDVEFPYLYRATRQLGFRRIAVRYSEAEPIEMAVAQTKDGVPLLDWVWIDTNTRLPLDAGAVEKLRPFKTCLVCPERWGRPQDILPYRRRMAALGFAPDAVMTSAACAGTWLKDLPTDPACP